MRLPAQLSCPAVSISTKNGWQLVPYTTDMAHAKVDAKQLGFKINDSQTKNTGDTETFSLTNPWQVTENGRLPISYDAVVICGFHSQSRSRMC